MRKIIYSLLLCAFSLCACMPSVAATTTNVAMTKLVHGQTTPSWEVTVNDDLDLIDAYIGAAKGSLTTLDARLDVSLNNDGTLKDGSTILSSGSSAFLNYKTSVSGSGASDGATIGLHDSFGLMIYNYETSATYGNISFGTSNAERMKIDPSGNIAIDTSTLYIDAVNNMVGVLTATPHYSFDIGGDLRIRSNNKLYFYGTGAGDAGPFIYGDAASGLQIGFPNETENFFVHSGSFIMPHITVPAHNYSAGVRGQIAWDADYLYVCNGGTPTPSWKRVQLDLVSW